MISFSKFILESKSDIIFSFSKNHKDYSFSGKSKKEVYCKVLDWLFNNGYNFYKEKSEGTILNLDKIKSIISKTNYRKDHFYNISNSDNYIKILSPGTGYLDKGGMIYNILLNFGCEQLKLLKSVTDENIDDDIYTKVEPTTTEPMKNKKYSTLEAVQIILKKNDNNPMTSNEIWNEINKIGLDINFLKHTMISRIGHFSINSGHANKSDAPLFKVVSRSPIKYVLLNPESEIIETDDEVFDPPLGKYWAVGIPGSSDLSEEFLDSGIWYDGYGKVGDERNKNILDRVKVGDVILMKSSSTKGPGRTISFTKLKGIGIVTSKEDYYLFNVDWIDSDDLPKDFDGISYRKTIEPMRDDEMLKFAKSIIGEDPTSESDSEESDEEFENKGSYSSEELVKKLKLLLVYGKDERNVTRLNETMRNVMKIFLQTLLSKNKTFNREEIKEELFENGVGESVGRAGTILSNLSTFITRENNDFLRQIISYDIFQFGLSAHKQAGEKKDNYKIIDEYRELVSEVLDEIDVNINDKVLPFNKYVTSTHDIVPDYYTTFKQPQQDKKSSTSKYNWTLSSEVDSEEDDMRIAKEERDRIATTSREKNPFGGFEKSDANDAKGISAILVLGESGAGKSFTISKILKSKGHKFEFIIPTAATTGLLSQYSPSKKSYVPSRLSRMIIEAYKNPEKLYTAVFDECHKSNVIEMINDELLQAISKRRNIGDRFISLDDDTSDEVFADLSRLYATEDEEEYKDKQGNIKIPDNLGFIFISSNPKVIGGNPDFFNRVDLVEITKDNRNDFKSCDDLLEKSLKDRDKKKDLIDNLKTKNLI